MIYRNSTLWRASRVRGPASDPELLILASQASVSKPATRSGDVAVFAGVKLGPGTLYTAITRLVERNLIAPQPSDGRQRPYRLTAEGATLLANQLKEMRRVAVVGLTRLRPA